jgi:subtilisin-like proprotein convertase family protein
MKNRIWISAFALALLVVLLWRGSESRRDQSAESSRADSRPAGQGGFFAVPGRGKISGIGSGGATNSVTLISIRRDPGFPYRLKNSQKSATEMFRSETGVLLRNAHIETTEPLESLGIPAHLRAKGDPGAYIIQAKGAVTAKFRAAVEAAGAKVVSYVPHNSFLVQASAEAIGRIAFVAGVQSTLRFEPYYKLDSELLPIAVNQERVPDRRFIRVALFPGAGEEARAKVLATGAQLLNTTRFPFGDVLTVYPDPESLVALAQISEVQLLEVHNKKVLLNDLTRVRVGIAPNAGTTSYQGLSGSNVTVAVTDTGIETTHSEFTGRILLGPDSPETDSSGHGTHVAGIIAGSGVNQGNPVNGSLSGGIYSGKAPAATLYPMPIGTAEATNNINANGVINVVNVTYSSAGYRQAPLVFVFDTSPRTTNGAGIQLTPGTGADLEAVLDVNGRVTSITILDGGTNYTLTNMFLTIDPPLSDFQIITNIASETNIFIVNNSWGTGFAGYDTLAATYDAAVRDSMPHWYGDQQINYIFAAGNNGFGTTRGEGGVADSIDSPGTGKNVITVGSSESERNVANSTNFPYAAEESDKAGDVADFSSRGNVGIGLEGDFGRFKPDLVTPGTWILSAASTAASQTATDAQATGSTNGLLRYLSGTSMSAPAVSGMLALMEEFFRSRGQTNSPALNKALLINSARSIRSSYDISPRVNINYQGWGIPSLTNAIPLSQGAITNGGGTATAQLVYIDQRGFSTNRLRTGETHNYDVTVSGVNELQSPLRVTLVWTDPPGNPLTSIKLVNDLNLSVSNSTFGGQTFLGNFIPQGSDFNEAFFVATNSDFTVNHDNVNNVETVIIQSVTNAGTATYRIRVSGKRVNVNADVTDTNEVVQDYALVVSLDAPPNSVGVTNLLTMTHMPLEDGVTNRPVQTILNGIPERDQVVGANFQLLTNNIHGATNQWNFYTFTNIALLPITNLTTNITGTTTNISTNLVTPLTNVGPYVAFATYFPPNASRARNRDADIDLYMTRSSSPPPNGIESLTNLDLATLEHANTQRSTNRGGVELLSMTNSFVGEEFYVGVKSEDQQSAKFSFIGIASDIPFTQTNSNGAVVINFIPVPQEIPDGFADSPQGVTLLGISTMATNVINPVVSNSISHENFGDLSVSLSHDGVSILLWDHNTDAAPGAFRTRTRYFNTTNPTNRPDGFADLTAFIDQDAIGVWEMVVIDDANTHTGQVNGASLTIGDDPGNRTDRPNGTTITVTIPSGESYVGVVFVDSTVTNMGVFIQNAPNTSPGVDQFVAFNTVPPDPFATNLFQTNINGTNFSTTNVTTNLNVAALYAPATATTTNFINSGTQPALQPGSWFIRVVNNTSGPLTVDIIVDFYRNLALGGLEVFENVISNNLVDISSTNLTVEIPEYRLVASVEVGVGITHERGSDLSGWIVSPSGSRILLFENRGWTNENMFANFTEDVFLSTSILTNRLTGGMWHLTNVIPIKAVTNLFTNGISPPLMVASNVVGISDDSIPEGVHSPGKSLYIVGQRKNAALASSALWHGALYNYPLPMTNDFMPTNWMALWPGDTPNGNANKGDVRLKDVVATPQFAYAVADLNQDYFLVNRANDGSAEEHITDFDTASTAGTFGITFTTFTVPDHLHVYHDGLPIITAPYPGIGTGGFVTSNALYAGASSFIRIVFNQGGNTSPGTAWINAGASVTPTAAVSGLNQSIVLAYDNTGSNFVGEADGGARLLSRGVTNNPYGAIGADRLFAIATSFEPLATNFYQTVAMTNFLYVVGSAEFPGGAAGDEKFFISKVHPDGRPLWTASEQVQAAAEVIQGGGGITSATVLFGGTNYSSGSPPTVTIEDDYDAGAGATATATVGINGNVTAISIGAAGSGYLNPRIEIAKPTLTNLRPSAGYDVMVMGNTNVFAVGFTNGAAGDFPAMWNYTTNGYLNWNAANTNVTGRFFAGTISRTNVYAVGSVTNGTADYTASYVARWDRLGNPVTNQTFTSLSELAGFPEDTLTEVIAVENPNRVYAVGTRTNVDNSTDAFLLELDSESLALISTTILNGGGTENDVGKGVSSDGKDLYVTVQSEDGPRVTTEVYRFRIRNYYLPEENLNQLLGEPTWFIRGNNTNKNWTLEIEDSRLGGTNANVDYWNLNLTYAASIIPPTLFNNVFGFTGTLLSRQPKSFFVDVPQGSQSMTLSFTASQAITAAISFGGLPQIGHANTTVLVSELAGDNVTLSSTSGFNLLAGRYYVTIQNGIEIGSANNVELSVAFDGSTPAPVIPLLTSGVSQADQVPPGGDFKVYRFDVPQGASGAQFELSPVLGNVNLYLRKGTSFGSVPTASDFDYRSMRSALDPETIFVVPDAGSARGLTAGTWYVGVQNSDINAQTYEVKATSFNGVPYNVVPLPSGAVGHPDEAAGNVGNAPNDMFKLTVPAGTQSAIFQVLNLGGRGDLIVRKEAFPVGNRVDAISANPGVQSETAAVRTSATLTSLAGDWYFGVLNHEETNISYSVTARLPNPSGLLVSAEPIRIQSVPIPANAGSAGNFELGLGGVPGEKYQIQFSPSPAAGWTVLTNIVAPQNGAIEFLHQSALSNASLFYRIEQVP